MKDDTINTEKLLAFLDTRIAHYHKVLQSMEDEQCRGALHELEFVRQGVQNHRAFIDPETPFDPKNPALLERREMQALDGIPHAGFRSRLASKHRIYAIARYRKRTGCSLRQAKKVCDEYIEKIRREEKC